MPSWVKTILKTFGVVLVLLVVAVGASAAYVYYTGKKAPVTTTQAPVAKPSTQLKKPPAPDPKAPVGVAIQTLTSPVTPGSNALVTIRTTPTADCVIKVEYNKVPAKDSGLLAKQADDYGTATWSWTVDANAPLGKWPVNVTCTYLKKSGMVEGSLDLVKTLP